MGRERESPQHDEKNRRGRKEVGERGLRSRTDDLIAYDTILTVLSLLSVNR